jgi:hypothetical protein
MKQETLEEAVENYNDKFQESAGSKPPYIKNQHIMNHFIAGAKWQSERMYSEEEVRKIAEEVRWQVQATCNPREFTKNFDKWFEQFKKK